MDVVAKICALPLEFKARGTVSVVQLIDESGYRSTRAALTVEAVWAYLGGRPDLIDAWLAYSEDKRTSSGWYITQRSGDSFESATTRKVNASPSRKGRPAALSSLCERLPRLLANPGLHRAGRIALRALSRARR